MICAEPLRFPEDYRTNIVRRRRSDEKDSLALSREIFKNITKQLRENIKREGATDRNDHLLQSEYRFSRPLYVLDVRGLITIKKYESAYFYSDF